MKKGYQEEPIKFLPPSGTKGRKQTYMKVTGTVEKKCYTALQARSKSDTQASSRS